jgi:hypothetical protein
MAVLFSIFYIVLVEGISLYFVPVIDFRNYAIGNDLRELVQGENDSYEVVMTFEKDGEQRDFKQDSIPDETWQFVENRSVLVSKGKEPVIDDFSILDWENDYDVSETILADTGAVFIMVAEFLEEASVGRVDKINELYDYCLDNELLFVAATSSDEENVELWRKRTGAEYPIYWADNILLRNMIRANPGVLLIRDGVVTGKWNVWNMPDAEQMMLLKNADKKIKIGALHLDNTLFWILLFVLPMAVIVLIDLATGRKSNPVKNIAEIETAKKRK